MQKKVDLKYIIYVGIILFSISNNIKAQCHYRETIEDNLRLNTDSNYDSCLFPHDANFNTVTFSHDATFSGATFSHDANFDTAIFSHYADFSGTTFLHDAKFRTANFLSNTNFFRANFSSNAYFNDAIFSHIIVFFHASFSHNIYFWGAHFSQKAIFSKIQLKDAAEFNFVGARLPDTIEFSYVTGINKEIDLTTANFDTLKKTPDRFHYINLYKSNISKFHIDYTHFRLLFYHLPEDERIALYEQVLKNFKDRGQETSYRNLDIEYQDYKWSLGSWWSRKLGKLIKLWWCYGYDKGAVFWHSLEFVLLFTIVNFCMLNYLNLKVYKISKIPEVHWNSIKAIFLRLWYSFAYTATIFFSLTLKPDKIEFKKIGGSIYLFAIYSIGLVCLAYMANFVLQK